MNPPYKGSLHLEILDQMLKVFMSENTEIVNLSPIPWLKDILAELKQGTEYKKYKHILKYLADLGVIPILKANYLFGINAPGDLGIYYFTNDGGFDVDNFRFGTPEKKLVHKLAVDVFPNHERFTFDMDFTKEFKFTFPAIAGDKGKTGWGYLTSMTKEIAFSYEGNNPKKTYIKLSFDTELERDHFYNSLFTKFYYFSVFLLRRTLYTPTILPFLPHFLNTYWEGKSGTIDGYKNKITDEMLYEYFGLTEEEIKIIEEFSEIVIKQK